jgi:superfamily II DNA helicase RecQ
MPLISLIEDQIYQLSQRNIKCIKFAKLSANTEKDFYKNLLTGRDPNMKLIYLTPEKMVQSKSFVSILDKLYEENLIARFVIDEVHCVSHWG